MSNETLTDIMVGAPVDPASQAPEASPEIIGGFQDEGFSDDPLGN
jgi:hypothetical protein